jgi:hypothetical protein
VYGLIVCPSPAAYSNPYSNPLVCCSGLYIRVRNGHVGKPDAAPELGHVELHARTPLIAGLCLATLLSYINSLTCPSSSRARE